MGQERHGQVYPLAIDEHLHGQALELREQSLVGMNDAEQLLLYGAVEGAERTEALAEYNRHEEQLNKLTQYCVRNGLLELETMAA